MQVNCSPRQPFACKFRLSYIAGAAKSELVAWERYARAASESRACEEVGKAAGRGRVQWPQQGAPGPLYLLGIGFGVLRADGFLL